MRVAGLARASWPPRLSGDVAGLPALADETLRMSVLAIVVVTRSALTLARAFSEGVWALALLFVLFPGELPGALALGLYNAAVLARLMAHVYDSADLRALHALRDQGTALPCAVAYALVPQSLTRCAGYVFYRWEVCVRATAVVGVVGAGGLGRRLEERLAAFDYAGVAATLVFYVALTLGVDACSAWARRALRRA